MEGRFFIELSRAVWGMPMVAVLMAGGLWLSWCSGFVQIRRFGAAMKSALGGMLRPRGAGGLSPFEAVCTALAGTVGTGNIAGVMIALTLGGPGAVFWMWVSAFIGMGTKYAEIVLAMRYRERRGGAYLGGMMYCVKNGLGRPFLWLAVLFCVFGTAASFGIGNLMQIGSITRVTGGALGIPAPLMGAAMAAAVYLAIRGGAESRGRIASLLVPLMAGLYVAAALTVIGLNIDRLPGAIGDIFRGALSPRAALWGGAGEAVSWGFKRGLFSNEAGMGSSPMAHASVGGGSPVEQGYMGIFEVFADTLVLCTLTALMVLCSGVPIVYGSAGGAEYCALALGSVFGQRLSGLFMAAAMGLFAFSSILGWSLYGERCVGFLSGGRGVGVYRAIFSAVTFLGSVVGFEAVIGISDIANALMILPNMASLILLSPEVRKITRGSPGGTGAVSYEN